MKQKLILILVMLSAASCAVRPGKAPAWTPGNALRQVGVPVISDDQDKESLVHAIDLTLGKLAKMDAAEVIHLGPKPSTIGRLRESLEDFRSHLLEMGISSLFFDYLKENYLFFRSAASRVLFTGYYEPLLRGSLHPIPGFPYPLYRRPDDLVTVELKQYSFFKEHPGLPTQIRGRLREDNHVVPYYSRQEIEDANRLAGKDLEIIWTDDPVEVFFLQIQGSGIIQLQDGERVRVGYADQNGHPYRSIGKLLLDTGVLERSSLSMQGIKRYLRQNPEKMSEILNYNPSYIFFRIQDDGPVGSFGVPLIPWRSIATDRHLFPQGGLVLIETEKPLLDSQGRILRWEKFRRFALNQDTGGAIRGADRVDLFCGSGSESELTAGSMRQPGTFYFLLKKD